MRKRKPARCLAVLLSVARVTLTNSGVLLAILFLFSSSEAVAAPTTPSDAQFAAENWLGLDVKPLGSKLGRHVRNVQTFLDASGDPLYHIVNLAPNGFIVISGDDFVEPVVGFSSKGTYNRSWKSPLGALVDRDLSGRVSNTRRAEHRASVEGRVFEPADHMVKALNRWESLKITASAVKDSTEFSTLSDVWVSPLVQSEWSQRTVGQVACYNYYTPPFFDGDVNNDYAGCVATAGAQLMRYYSYPTTGVGTGSYDYYTGPWATKLRESGNLRGGNGAGGPYGWANMPLVPDSSTSGSQCQEIGALLWDVGIASHMDYDTSASGAYVPDLANALKNTFYYANAVFSGAYDKKTDIPSNALIGMINPNLDASFPVVLAIAVENGSGHVVLADGYGYDATVLRTLYHHLNMGWAGQDDIWYNLPNVDTGTQGDYSVVDGCIYNVYSAGSGEIISGRVTGYSGAPIRGVTIAAVESRGGTYTAITKGTGIYALAKIPSASSYTIMASKTGYDFGEAQTVSTLTSTDGSNTVGNVWGVDFIAHPSMPVVNKPTVPSITNRGATLGATIESNGGAKVTAAGAAYGTNLNPDSYGTKVGTPSTKGAFTVSVTGLAPNTVCHFRGYATNSQGTSYTDDSTFTTVSDPPTATTPTGLSAVGFTANWTPPSGLATIKSYRLDVATDKGFSSYVTGYKALTVSGTDTSTQVTGLARGKSYYYRVRAVNDGGTSASSNSIQVAIPTPTAVKLTSPSSGEKFSGGGLCQISWSYTGSLGLVNIDLLQNGQKVLSIKSNTSAGSKGKGSCSWTIPVAQTSGTTYQIQISSALGTPYAAGPDFEIDATAINVTSPASGQTFAPGGKCAISWTSMGNPGNVEIDLVQSGSTVLVIKSKATAGSNGKGSYTWRIPKTETQGTGYTVKVTSTSGSSIFGTSGAFSITK